MFFWCFLGAFWCFLGAFWMIFDCSGTVLTHCPYVLALFYLVWALLGKALLSIWVVQTHTYQVIGKGFPFPGWCKVIATWVDGGAGGGGGGGC